MFFRLDGGGHAHAEVATRLSTAFAAACGDIEGSLPRVGATIAHASGAETGEPIANTIVTAADTTILPGASA